VPDPKDWIDDDDAPSSSDSDNSSSAKSEKDGKSDGSIGGPANLH